MRCCDRDDPLWIRFYLGCFFCITFDTIVYIVGFVLNPSSGGGDAFKKWTSILPRVRELFADNWKVLPTTKRGDAVDFTKQLINEGYNVIVSVGGDGTHNEVLTLTETPSSS